LNGEKLFLRGTQRHEDHAGLGAAMTEDLTRKEMQLVKEVGANFIRLAHYQQSRLVLDCAMSWESWCGRRYPGAAAGSAATSTRNRRAACCAT